MAPVYGYWNMRGLAEPSRYLLHYTGTEFEDKRYAFSEGSTFEDITKLWMKEKFGLGLDFPNLPYYIDGDLKLTQSTAILRHLARKHGLVATSEEDTIKQDLIEQQALDLRRLLGIVAYSQTENFEEEKAGYMQQLPAKLKQFSDFLAKKQWMIGDKLTYVDFLAYEIIDFQRLLEPNCVDEFPNLKEYLTGFESLPAIASYMKSKQFVKFPIFFPFAAWGGK